MSKLPYLGTDRLEARDRGAVLRRQHERLEREPDDRGFLTIHVLFVVQPVPRELTLVGQHRQPGHPLDASRAGDRGEERAERVAVVGWDIHAVHRRGEQAVAAVRERHENGTRTALG